MAGNEAAAFIIDADTVCAHFLQGTPVGEYGADESTNAIDLTENSAASTQVNGYGQDVKADGEDVGRYYASSGSPFDEALVSANNAALKETGDHIVELILEPVDYTGWQGTTGGVWSTGTGSYYGLEIYFPADDSLRAYWGKGAGQRCIISSGGSIGDPSDSYAVTWRYDSSGAGGMSVDGGQVRPVRRESSWRADSCACRKSGGALKRAVQCGF